MSYVGSFHIQHGHWIFAKFSRKVSLCDDTFYYSIILFHFYFYTLYTGFFFPIFFQFSVPVRVLKKILSHFLCRARVRVQCSAWTTQDLRYKIPHAWVSWYRPIHLLNIPTELTNDRVTLRAVNRIMLNICWHRWHGSVLLEQQDTDKHKHSNGTDECLCHQITG